MYECIQILINPNILKKSENSNDLKEEDKKEQAMWTYWFQSHASQTTKRNILLLLSCMGVQSVIVYFTNTNKKESNETEMIDR